jgi:hypothetical protein
MARTPKREAEAFGFNPGEAPDLKGVQLTMDLGVTGLRQFNGWVREDWVPNLIGRQGATVYREMLDSSPVVGAVMFAIMGVMRKAEWRVISATDKPEGDENVEFVTSLMHDMSHSWEDFVVEALSMLGYGYSLHEIVYKRRNGERPKRSKFGGSNEDDGRIGWRRLPIRSQDTILKWYFDGNGQILGFQQQPWVGHLVDIPIEKALLFRPTQHKGNPEGRSILRNAYRPYYFIKRLEEGEAITIERMAGNVIVRVPTALLDKAASGDPAAVATLNGYKKMATRSRTDEQMGIILPSDTFMGANGPTNVPMFSYEYITPQGGAKGIEPNIPITRHKLDIMATVLADFIQMGHSEHGTYNLADIKVDVFMTAVQAWLKSVASVINDHALPRLWKLNGMDLDTMPQLQPDMPTQVNLDELSNFILRLSQSGVPLFPDEDLEDFIRDTAGFPDRKDGKKWETEKPEPTQPGQPGQKPAARAAAAKALAEEIEARARGE